METLTPKRLTARGHFVLQQWKISYKNEWDSTRDEIISHLPQEALDKLDTYYGVYRTAHGDRLKKMFGYDLFR